MVGQLRRPEEVVPARDRVNGADQQLDANLEQRDSNRIVARLSKIIMVIAGDAAAQSVRRPELRSLGEVQLN